MKRLLLLVLLVPFVSAEGLLEGGFTITYNESGNLTVETVNVSLPFTIPFSCEEPAAETPACDNLTITGLPLVAESGEKLSYGFSPWQDGDEVMYWIEDAHGEVVKQPYTTTSKSKKSYTPSFDEDEKAIFFRAERVRDGCDPSSASAVVVILGEEQAAADECVCEPIADECSCGPGIVSLYVRAKKWQENVTLYGNVEEGGLYVLFGEEPVRHLSLPAGEFSMSINPGKGNNTYGLAPLGSVKLASFMLAYEEGSSIEENDTMGNSTVGDDALLGSYSFPATGEVILDDGVSGNATLLAAIVGVLGVSLAVARFRTKSLRSGACSENRYGGSRHEAEQEGCQGEGA
ncbi:hypothetical protein JXA12_03875 [Candidatus Woesearchaeota archaeon]|nr:hypothetical protein [Candidatus Woesearchaeota archaeon]